MTRSTENEPSTQTQLAEPRSVQLIAGYRPQRIVSGVVITGLSLFAVFELFRMGVGVLAMHGSGVFNGGQADPELKDLALLAYVFAALPQLLLGLPVIVFYCIWVYRSAVNARALGAGGFQFSPGWAVGWYFIPIACLWMPYKAMSEIIRASRPALPFTDSTAWWDIRTGPILPLWWATWIIGHAIARIGHTLWQDRIGIGLDAIGASMIPIGHAIRGVAAVLCCVLINRVTVDQRTRAHRITSEAGQELLG